MRNPVVCCCWPPKYVSLLCWCVPAWVFACAACLHVQQYLQHGSHYSKYVFTNIITLFYRLLTRKCIFNSIDFVPTVNSSSVNTRCTEQWWSHAVAQCAVTRPASSLWQMAKKKTTVSVWKSMLNSGLSWNGVSCRESGLMSTHHFWRKMSIHNRQGW